MDSPLQSITRVSSVAKECPLNECTTLKDLNCCIQGTCLSKTEPILLGLFSSIRIGFDIRVDQSKKSWIVRCTLKDVWKLHHNLRENIKDIDFQESLAFLPCPKEPLFNRRDMDVIKSLCVHLDHYIDELLKLSQRFIQCPTTNAKEAHFVDRYIRTFLNLPII